MHDNAAYCLPAIQLVIEPRAVDLILKRLGNCNLCGYKHLGNFPRFILCATGDLVAHAFFWALFDAT